MKTKFNNDNEVQITILKLRLYKDYTALYDPIYKDLWNYMMSGHYAQSGHYSQ